MKTIDMLGQPCPIPVIQAKKALAEPGAEGVAVLVDNIVAVQNLQKMAEGMGYDFSHTQQADDQYTVSISRSGGAWPVAAVPPAQSGEHGAGGMTVLISADQMGRGSEELGRILIKGFIFSLTELQPLPEAVLFINSGVKLAAEGANTLADLHTLAAKGVKILACGTCLNYYNLTEQLAVGEIVDMLGIATALNAGAGVLTL